MASYFNDPLIPIKQQAPSGMFIINTSGDEERVYDTDTGYADFTATALVEKLFTHKNLPYCSAHTIGATDSGTVDINFYAGDIVVRTEKLQGARETFIQAGVTKIGFKTESSTATVRSWSSNEPINEAEVDPNLPISFANTREGTNNPNSFLRLFDINGAEVFRMQYGYSLDQIAAVRSVPIWSTDYDASALDSNMTSTYDAGETEGFAAAVLTTNVTPDQIVNEPIQILKANEATATFSQANINFFTATNDLVGDTSNAPVTGLAIETFTNGAMYSVRIYDVVSMENILIFQMGSGGASATRPFAINFPNTDYYIFSDMTQNNQAIPVNSQVTDASKAVGSIMFRSATTATGANRGELITYTAIWVKGFGGTTVIEHPQLKITNSATDQTVEFFNTDHTLLTTMKFGTVERADASNGDNTVTFDAPMPGLNYTVFTETYLSAGELTTQTVSNPYSRAAGSFKTYLREGVNDDQEKFDWMLIFDDVEQEEVGVVFTAAGTAAYPNIFLRMDKTVGDKELANLQYGFNSATGFSQRSVPLEPITTTSSNTGYVTANTFDSTSDIVVTDAPSLETVSSNKNAPVAVVDASTEQFVTDKITYFASEILPSDFTSPEGTGLGIEIKSVVVTDSNLTPFANDIGYIRIFDNETGVTLVVIQQFIQLTSDTKDFLYELPDENYTVTANGEVASSQPHTVRVTQKNRGSVDIELVDASTGSVQSTFIVSGMIFWAIDQDYVTEYMRILTKTSATAGTNQTIEFYGVNQEGLISTLSFGSFPNASSSTEVIEFNKSLPDTIYTVQNILIGTTSSAADRKETVNVDSLTPSQFTAYNFKDGSSGGDSGCDWLVMWAHDNRPEAQNKFFWTNIDPVAGIIPNSYLNFFDDENTLVFRSQYGGYSLSCDTSTRELPYLPNDDELPAVICGTYNDAIGANNRSGARGIMAGGVLSNTAPQNISADIFQMDGPAVISQDTFCMVANQTDLAVNRTSPVTPAGTGIQTIYQQSANDTQTIIRYFSEPDFGVPSSQFVVMAGHCTADTFLTFTTSFELPNTNYVILLTPDKNVITASKFYAPSYQEKSVTGFKPLLFDINGVKDTTTVGMNYMVVWAADSFDSDTLRISKDSNGHHRVEFHGKSDVHNVNELLCTWLFDNEPTLPPGENSGLISFGQSLPSTNYVPFTTPHNAGQTTQKAATTNILTRNLGALGFMNVNNDDFSVAQYGFGWLVIANAIVAPVETLSFSNTEASPTSLQYFRAFDPSGNEVYKLQTGENTQTSSGITNTPFEATSGVANIMHVSWLSDNTNRFDGAVFNTDGATIIPPAKSLIMLSDQGTSGFAKIYEGQFLLEFHTVAQAISQNNLGNNIGLDIFSDTTTPNQPGGSLRYYEKSGGENIFIIQSLEVQVTSSQMSLGLVPNLPDTDYTIIASCGGDDSSLFNVHLIPSSKTQVSYDVQVRNAVDGSVVLDEFVHITVYWARNEDFTSDIINVKAAGTSSKTRAVEFFAPNQGGRLALLNFGSRTTNGGFDNFQIPQPNLTFVNAISTEATQTRAMTILFDYSTTQIRPDGFIGFDGADLTAHWSTWFIRPPIPTS